MIVTSTADRKDTTFAVKIHQINVQTRIKDSFSETQSENHLLRTDEVIELMWGMRTRDYPGNDDSVNQSDRRIFAHAHTCAWLKLQQTQQ